MKLRVRGNSIRLRLTQGEVATILDGGAIEEHTMFPGGARFGYRFETGDVGAAQFDGGVVRIVWPRDDAKEWATSDRVGLSTSFGELKVVVEKDFACLKPREGGEDLDTFPHPRA